ncbi:MAG TPA: Crp/Fnr family transcriptional regulator [Candidatus Limnocylindria bacterium]|nr:Crp/Fnr family transcriptional regulator [Candidatus Limnocylindria bacterium]
MDGATTEEIPAGALTYRPGAADPRVALVISGLFRVYYEASDGRQVTVRYARPGDVLGVVAAAGGPAAPVHTQALTDSTRVVMDLAKLRSLAQRDPDVAWGMVEELSRMVFSLWHELADTAFASVPQRVARHLLEIAATQQESGAPLVARVSQQELADLAGSVREVVARALRELKTEGIVRITRSRITVVDPSRLAERAWSR